VAQEDQPEPASHKQQLCVAHDFAATFALLELILKLKTSNGAGVPQKPNPTDLLMQPPCMD